MHDHPAARSGTGPPGANPVQLPGGRGVGEASVERRRVPIGDPGPGGCGRSARVRRVDPAARGPIRVPLAWRALAPILVLDAGLLAVTATRYGYHRDELYFRLLGFHPAWGYLDQPPLTPLIARAAIAVLGDSVWALRVPAALCALAVVVLTAALTAELGGGARAQVMAAGGTSCPFVFVIGHTFLTAGVDLVAWLLVLWFAARALIRADPRWWIATGVVVGLALYNKNLVVLLLIGLLVGIAVSGPRAVFALWQVWAGLAAVALIGWPNILFQAMNGWPALSMARAIEADKGSDDRIFFVPFQLVLLGILVAPVWVAGMARMLRDPAWRSLRALAVAYPVVCVIVLLTGGQAYYPFGLLLLLYAAGCVRAGDRVEGRRSAWADRVGGPVVAANLVIAVGVTLPVFPVRAIPAPVAAINQVVRDSVGWPRYVDEVAEVVATLPAADRSRAVLLAGNYGEAGALDRFGPGRGLPPVYSGHNQLFRLGPPPDSATVVVTVGLDASSSFASCDQVRQLDDEVGVANEEQGRWISVCRGPRSPWAQLWPSFAHRD
jgi:Dolichyl-phosphate-mannose-protein mannosyltransferase